MSRFFLATAVIEVGAGLGLVAAPEIVAKLLFAADVGGAGAPLGRMAGVALLALGVASWLTRDRPAKALVSGMLLYNCGVAFVLAVAGLSGMTGILLWPAVALHAAMTIWSLFSLQSATG
jgi:hypothetical protein